MTIKLTEAEKIQKILKESNIEMIIMSLII